MKNLVGAFLSAACLAAAGASMADVVVDTGHSPASPGVTSASGIPEFDYNRAFVLALDRQFKALGIAHRFTNPADPLEARAASAAGADLLLSIHHDSVQPQYLNRAGDFSGYSLFVSRKQYPWRAAYACAAQIGAQLQATGRPHSTHHAEPIPHEGRPWLNESLGIASFDDLRLLKAAKVPAVLLEVAVVVNPREEALASSQAWVDGQARAIALAVANCVRPVAGSRSLP